jgi:hypothetical protein
MGLPGVLAALGVPAARLPQALEALSPHWAASRASLLLEHGTGGTIPWFLSAPEVRAACDWGGLPPEAEVVLLREADRVAADPGLRLLAWHCHALLFDHDDDGEKADDGDEAAGYGAARVGAWPEAELGGPFLLLVALGMVRRTREAHASVVLGGAGAWAGGVPEEVTRATCGQLACFCRTYARMRATAATAAAAAAAATTTTTTTTTAQLAQSHEPDEPREAPVAPVAHVGLCLSQLAWTRHYPRGRLFRLGRFEFMARPWKGGVVAFRHRLSGQVVALAPHGARFTAEGVVAREPEGGAAEGGDAEGAWTATLVETPERALGSVVSPLGHALRSEANVSLDLAAWECVLRPGDVTLDLHIPEGGHMGLDACGASLRAGAAFFAAVASSRGRAPCRAVTCSSWVLNPQFERIQLSSGNLVAFQREVHLFPVPFTTSRDGLWCIFLQGSGSAGDVDLAADGARDTSLRRGVADFLLAASRDGERWRGNGGMFLLVDDLPRFGSQCYRNSGSGHLDGDA